MAVSGTLILCLIAAGSVLAQTTIYDDLGSIKDSIATVQGICEAASSGDVVAAQTLIFSQLRPAIVTASNNVARFSESPGSFLRNQANENRLIETVNAITAANTGCLTALNTRFAQLPQTQILIKLILDRLELMVSGVTGAMQEKLNKWSTSYLLSLPAILQNTRTTLLNSLGDFATQVCPYKHSTVTGVDPQTRIFAETVLNSVIAATNQVTLATCKGLLTCLLQLIPLADNIRTSAQCPAP